MLEYGLIRDIIHFSVVGNGLMPTWLIWEKIEESDITLLEPFPLRGITEAMKMTTDF